MVSTTRKHFSRFSDETLLKVFGAAQSRVVVETTDVNNVTTRALLAQRISHSVIPDRVVSGADAPLDESTQSESVHASNLSAQHRSPLVAKLNTVTPVFAFRANDAALDFDQSRDHAGRGDRRRN